MSEDQKKDIELKKNQEFAEANLETFRVRYLHKYLVIYEREIVAIFLTFQDASEYGLSYYGIDKPFLIYHVEEEKKPMNFLFRSHPITQPSYSKQPA